MRSFFKENWGTVLVSVVIVIYCWFATEAIQQRGETSFFLPSALGVVAAMALVGYVRHWRKAGKIYFEDYRSKESFMITMSFLSIGFFTFRYISWNNLHLLVLQWVESLMITAKLLFGLGVIAVVIFSVVIVPFRWWSKHRHP